MADVIFDDSELALALIVEKEIGLRNQKFLVDTAAVQQVDSQVQTADVDRIAGLINRALVAVARQCSITNGFLDESLDLLEVMNRNVYHRHLRLNQHVSEVPLVGQENIIAVAQLCRVHAKSP